MWCEQNKKRILSAVSHLRVNLPRYCDHTNRRIPALKGKTIAIFPHRFLSQRRVHVFVTRISLEGAAGTARSSKGALLYFQQLSGGVGLGARRPVGGRPPLMLTL